MKRILKKTSQYLIDYRKRNMITQHEMAQLIGMSISRYSELERNTGHCGLALKTIMIIAELEYETLADFLIDQEAC